MLPLPLNPIKVFPRKIPLVILMGFSPHHPVMSSFQNKTAEIKILTSSLPCMEKTFSTWPPCCDFSHGMSYFQNLKGRRLRFLPAAQRDGLVKGRVLVVVLISSHYYDGLKFVCIDFSSQQQKRRKALCIQTDLFLSFRIALPSFRIERYVCLRECKNMRETNQSMSMHCT